MSEYLMHPESFYSLLNQRKPIMNEWLNKKLINKKYITDQINFKIQKIKIKNIPAQKFDDGSESSQHSLVFASPGDSGYYQVGVVYNNKLNLISGLIIKER